MNETQPASIHDIVLGLQLDNAVNIVSLNWILLTPQQKARVLSAIPRDEWPK
jgi:hypothetical protein